MVFCDVRVPPPSANAEIIGKALENIGIPDVRNAWDLRILEIIDIPLGILGIRGGADAATIDNSRND